MAGWVSGLAGWMAQRGERTDRWTDIRTENLPILQDFVPYWGRCPKMKKVRDKKEGIMDQQVGRGLEVEAWGTGGRKGSQMKG